MRSDISWREIYRVPAQAISRRIDVRGNGGGNTPGKLIDALIMQPYRDWTIASAMSVGMLKVYGSFSETTNKNDDPGTYGFENGLKTYFNRPMMYWPGSIHNPAHPICKGRLIVLTDRDCASACEDFVMPMKASHRATIVGDFTFGSSGQPITRRISKDISFRVSAKRMFFGDGSPFEGIGIEPDIKVMPTLEQIRNRVDPVLAKALTLAHQQQLRALKYYLSRKQERIASWQVAGKHRSPNLARLKSKLEKLYFADVHAALDSICAQARNLSSQFSTARRSPAHRNPTACHGNLG
jgi:C-terminal processing protease CtpA/Prc